MGFISLPVAQYGTGINSASLVLTSFYPFNIGRGALIRFAADIGYE